MNKVFRHVPPGSSCSICFVSHHLIYPAQLKIPQHKYLRLQSIILLTGILMSTVRIMHYDAVIFSFISFSLSFRFFLLAILCLWPPTYACVCGVSVCLPVSVSDVGSLRCCCYCSLLHAAAQKRLSPLCYGAATFDFSTKQN